MAISTSPGTVGFLLRLGAGEIATALEQAGWVVTVSRGALVIAQRQDLDTGCMWHFERGAATLVRCGHLDTPWKEWETWPVDAYVREMAADTHRSLIDALAPSLMKARFGR
jgi:hypothetical protein